MKIFVMSEGTYWRVENEEYEQYWKDMAMIQFYPCRKTYPEKIKRLDYSAEAFHGLGMDSLAGYESQNFRNLLNHAEEIYQK